MNVLLKIKLKKKINTFSLNGLTYHPIGNIFYTQEKSKNIYKWVKVKNVKSVKAIKLSKNE